MGILEYDFMQRALIAALLIGACAPAVGTYLVQRRLSLIGDGLGHVALTGVAIGLLTSTAPVWTALAAATAGAVAIELIRARGRTSGDVALAMLFYGGIAGAVVIAPRHGGSGSGDLSSYLFGAILTTTGQDLAIFAVLSVVVLVISLGLSRELFAISDDEDFARASGLPVLRLSLLLAVLTAVTVVVSMRVVGLLLIGALIVLPVATAQLVSRGFRATMALAIGIGTVVAVSGVVLSYYADTRSGGTIVLLAIGLFAVVTLASSAREAIRSRRENDPVPGAPTGTAGR